MMLKNSQQMFILTVVSILAMISLMVYFNVDFAVKCAPKKQMDQQETVVKEMRSQLDSLTSLINEIKAKRDEDQGFLEKMLSDKAEAVKQESVKKTDTFIHTFKGEYDAKLQEIKNILATNPRLMAGGTVYNPPPPDPRIDDYQQIHQNLGDPGGAPFATFAMPAPDPDPIVENTNRQKAVKDGFIHAWTGYKTYAWGHDELMPLSRRGKDWSKQGGGGLGMTILDSLSTLWLMGLKEEFELCVKWVKDELNFNKDVDISAFESTIRMVAGLISAYELSGEKHRFLIDKAADLTDRLLFAYNTTTGIPHATVNTLKKTHYNPKWTGGSSVLSEFGTVQLEFRTLSYHTGNDVYDRKATHIMNLIEKRLPPDGLVPTYLNSVTGKWTSDHITLGALGDSYYEYLLKQYLLTNKQEERYKRMFEQAATGVIDRLLKTSRPSGQTYIAEFKRGMLVHKMDHLACFSGGMFALGAHAIGGEHADKWLKIGADITETCHLMYKNTKTGVSPEIAEFKGGSDYTPGAAYYILRPETVESYFYLWRFTKQQKWRDYGWEMFSAVNHWCRVDSGGFSGLKNVNIVPPVKDDLMQSFFLAETMKYLYLLFSDDETLNLDEWVINTEAHPLKVRQKVPPQYPEEPIPGITDHYEMELGGGGGGGGGGARYDPRRDKPVPPGYRLMRQMDAANADLHPQASANKDPMELAKLCNSDTRCQGFNSNGYLKVDVSKPAHEYAADLYVKEQYATNVNR